MIFKDEKYIDVVKLILEGMPFSEIAQIEGIHDNTVRNINNRMQETGSAIPSRKRESIYDPIMKELQDIVLSLLKNGRRSYNRYKRVALTNKEIFQILRTMEFPITQTKTNDLAKSCRKILKNNYLHIHHIPGEKVEFDWGSINLHINDEKNTTRVYLAVFSFPYSNYKKIYVLEKSNGPAFVQALNQFITDMGGVPPLFILDNMKIARKFTTEIDSNVKLTSLFDELCNHFKFNVRFCSPYCPHEKGNVENNVGSIKHQFASSYVRSFKNIDEVQEFVDQQVLMLNERKHPFKNDTCENLINHERTFFIKSPKKEYVYYHEKHAKVYQKGFFRLNNNYYSVPELLKGQTVFVKYNDKKIIVYTPDKKDVIATYTPAPGSGKRNFRVWYMLYKLRVKSNAFQNSLEYRSMPKHLKLIFNKAFNKNPHSFLEFLAEIENKGKRKLRKFAYKNEYQPNYIFRKKLTQLLL